MYVSVDVADQPDCGQKKENNKEYPDQYTQYVEEYPENQKNDEDYKT
jgi:hypothetical protein